MSVLLALTTTALALLWRPEWKPSIVHRTRRRQALSQRGE